MKNADIKQIIKAYADSMGMEPPPERSGSLSRHFTEFEVELQYALRLFIERKTNCMTDRIYLDNLLAAPDDDPPYALFEFEALMTMMGQPDGLHNGQFAELFASKESLNDFIEQLKHNMCHLVNQDNQGALQVAIREEIHDHDRERVLEEGRYYCCLQEDEEDCIMTCSCRLVRQGEAVILFQCEAHEAVNAIAEKLHNK